MAERIPRKVYEKVCIKPRGQGFKGAKEGFIYIQVGQITIHHSNIDSS